MQLESKSTNIYYSKQNDTDHAIDSYWHNLIEKKKFRRKQWCKSKNEKSQWIQCFNCRNVYAELQDFVQNGLSDPLHKAAKGKKDILQRYPFVIIYDIYLFIFSYSLIFEQ